jgi:ParB family chromosome partitioning protein
MITQTIPISELHNDPANARRHDQRNIDAIMASLARFGQQKPIVIDSRNIVRAGNGTLAAAKALGWKEISVVKSDLPLAELTAYAIADNRTAELAEWDNDALALLAADGQLADLGFDDAEIKKILDDHDPQKDLNDSERIHQAHEVVVECRDEEQQQELFERFTAEGLTCRLFTL